MSFLVCSCVCVKCNETLNIPHRKQVVQCNPNIVPQFKSGTFGALQKPTPVDFLHEFLCMSQYHERDIMLEPFQVNGMKEW